ncbi:MAG: hypothetical protein ISS28_07170 [Candidatus Cloacimonetes bacterium]|nr:hypothetical protein [Candidatus Cloacimonadota bacterium]
MKNRKNVFWISAGCLLIFRISIFLFLQSNGFEFIAGDATDYLGTAENIASGRGFISPEYNPDNRRVYLGPNYYYSVEPVYPLYLVVFLLTGMESTYIVLISNFFLLLLIFWLSWGILQILNVGLWSSILVLAAIMLNPHIEFYSFQMLTELLRVSILLFCFYFLIVYSNNDFKGLYKSAISFGLLGGIVILGRISFLLIPIFILPVLLKKVEKTQQKIICVLIFVLSTLAVVSPWIYRNYTCFGIPSISPILSYKLTTGQILDRPKGMDSAKEELATVWRITNNEKYWKFQDEQDPLIRTKMLQEIKNTPTAWLKLYLLRTWELFKPFPTGGNFAHPLLQIYSFIFFVPWFTGLVLFLTGRIKSFHNVALWFGLGLISFIGVHILQNSPHARYMLPLVPIGYISFFVFIDQKIKEGFKLFKYRIGE